MPFSYAFMKAEWQAPRHGSGRLHLLAPASATGDFAKHDGFAKHSAKPNSAGRNGCKPAGEALTRTLWSAQGRFGTGAEQRAGVVWES